MAELSKETIENSKDFFTVPTISSSEKLADNPNTFLSKPRIQRMKHKAKDNEMDIAYTMDDPDEDSILQEDLQLTDDSLPEMSPSPILSRDLSRVTSWHKNDDALDEENEAEVQGTLQAIRGTQLMDYIKEVTLKQEQDHQRLLAAIRKAEETDLQENGMGSSHAESDSEETNDSSNGSQETVRPLSYYL